MAKDGILERNDIITDEALNWGNEYSKTIKKCITANKKFTKSVKKLKAVLNT